MLVIHVSYKPLKCGAFTPVLNLMVRHYELVIMKRQREQGAKREINLVKIKHKGQSSKGAIGKERLAENNTTIKFNT